MIEKKVISATLHQQNFRLTREREVLLDVFMSTEKILTPAQLHECSRVLETRIGLTTVYRLLEVLTKVGLATPIFLGGSVYYMFCDQEHHHHFICLACHRVLDIYECPTFEHLPTSFHVEFHRVDLFGTCSDCQQRQSEDSVTPLGDR